MHLQSGFDCTIEFVMTAIASPLPKRMTLVADSKQC